MNFLQTRTRLQQRYASLPLREQRALRLLAAFLAIVLGWQGAWLPITTARDRAKAQYVAALADIRWMKAHQAQAGAAPRPSQNADAPLLATVSESARGIGLSLARAEPLQDGTLQVSLENTSFPRIINWLTALQGEQGIVAARATVEKQTAHPGHVNATFTFRR
ncbi:MAG: type II secretion system protein M [Rickettsiales bacterium]|nr:type II secretion system protein M [Rickettsiales bacterium]